MTQSPQSNSPNSSYSMSSPNMEFRRTSPPTGAQSSSHTSSALLGKALDMNLHFTSSYHPEGDGQTECTNKILEQYLRVYCNYQQDNWAELLPIVEFAYNNAPSATTGVSPFFAKIGRASCR